MSFKRVKDIKSTRPEIRLRFTKIQKHQIITEAETGLSRTEVCQKYGIAYMTLSKWLKAAGSSLYQTGKRSGFTKYQKRSIVRAVIEGEMTKSEASTTYNISNDLLSYWISAFKKEEKELALENQSAMPKKVNTVHRSPETELHQARLKIKALETLIDIAEEQFKINIRKKPGAKQ